MLKTMPPAPAEALFETERTEASFGGVLGLAQGPSFHPAEVLRIKEIIKQHMLKVAAEISPHAVAALEATDVDLFHKVDGYDHAAMLSKRGRILSNDMVQEIKSMSFFDYVRDAFGEFYLADEEEVGHEQITFRLVRPGRLEDVGSLHRDAWFWEQFGTALPDGVNRTKVWVPICSEPQLNSLRLAPGSHRIAAPYEVDSSGRKLTFVPKFDVRQIGLRQFNGEPGTPILFNYKTLHVGSLNRGLRSRVSIETTIMYRST